MRLLNYFPLLYNYIKIETPLEVSIRSSVYTCGLLPAFLQYLQHFLPGQFPAAACLYFCVSTGGTISAYFCSISGVLV